MRNIRAAALASILASAMTIPMLWAQWGEPYPFFHWKLYSSPRGNKYTHTEYRLYARLPGAECFKRLSFRPLKGFTAGEYYYCLMSWAHVYETGDTASAIPALSALGRLDAPAAAAFELRTETHDPLKLIQDTNAYESQTIVSFN